MPTGTSTPTAPFSGYRPTPVKPWSLALANRQDCSTCLSKTFKTNNWLLNVLQQWLETHTQWLLILDNADDLALLDEFLPRRNTGHIQLTTRTQSVGTLANSVNVEPMEGVEGSLLLLRRAKKLPPNAPLVQASATDRATANKIVQELGGLPLALDQAAAYIEETEGGLPEYSHGYRAQRKTFLHRRGAQVSEHPEPVATTWSLSFANVEKTSPSSADLLRLCAFLHPDAIPQELLSESAPQVIPSLRALTDKAAFDEAIVSLRSYSLIRRHSETSTLSIHRLVQAVLKDSMDDEQQSQWAQRVVRMVNQVFPSVEFANWERCERYLLHALACISLIDTWNLASLEAVRLLNQVGWYLLERAQYREAQMPFQRAIVMCEQLDSDHISLAQSLNNLAELYWRQGRYWEPH